jgi:hypothetical protein
MMFRIDNVLDKGALTNVLISAPLVFEGRGRGIVHAEQIGVRVG